MTQRFHLIWPLVALSLALAVLSGFAAVGLVREQRDAAADLRGDVEQHRSVAELEECFIELIALVKHLLRRAPELEAQLAFAVPGFAAGRAVESTTFYWQAMDAIRGVNLGNDWAEHEVAEGLGLILASAGDFADKGELEASNAVVVGVADALVAAFVPEQREKVVAALPVKYRPAVSLRIAADCGNGAVENLPF